MLTVMGDDAPITGSWKCTYALARARPLKLPETEPQEGCRRVSKVKY